VKRINQGEFTLERVAVPKYPAFKATPRIIAIPHPEIRPSKVAEASVRSVNAWRRLAAPASA